MKERQNGVDNEKDDEDVVEVESALLLVILTWFVVEVAKYKQMYALKCIFPPLLFIGGPPKKA